MLKIVPITIHGPNAYTNTYALLDEGSTVTMIDSRIAYSIGIDGIKLRVNLKGIRDQTSVEIEAKKIDFRLRNSTGEYYIKNALSVEKLPLPSQRLSINIIKVCRENFGIQIESYVKAVPMVLLGQDNCDLIVSKESLKINGYPFAISRTQLGWCIHGPSRDLMNQRFPQINNSFVCLESPYTNSKEDEILSLDNLVRKYFQIDSLTTGNKQSLGLADKYALELLETKSKRIGNAWETCLLWKR